MHTVSRLSPRRGTWLVAIYATVQFLYAYWTHPLNPAMRLGIDAGWYGQADQAGYMRILRGFVQGELTRHFHYPPGYPVLGVPFFHITPLDPLVIPNIIIFVITCVLYFRLGCTFLTPALSLAALVLLSQDDLFLMFFVVPWNNMVPTFCLAVLFTFIVTPPRRIYLAATAIGVCLDWTLAARYGDVLLLLPPALGALFRLAPTWRQRFVLALIAGLATLPIVGWVGWIHDSIFGSPLTTPYTLHLSRITGYESQGLDSRSFTYLGYHLFSLLINPNVFDPATKFTPLVPSLWHRPLLSYYFVFLFAGVGVACIQHQHRLLAATFGASFALGLLYYGTFWSTSASDLKFFALRFFLPWQPMLAFAGLAGLVGLLQIDWRLPHNQRLVGVGLTSTLVLVVGLYSLGRIFPPFPDWARTIPPRGWVAAARAAPEQLAFVFDNSVGNGWWAQGVQPAGTTFTVDMRQPYQLDHLFLVRSVASKSGPVAVEATLSWDALHWFKPNDIQMETSEERIIGFHFAPTEARYIRFTLRHDSTPAGWGIDELIAYGDVPAVVILPGSIGWAREERSPEGAFRWLTSPASLSLAARQEQPVVVSFTVRETVHAESTLVLSDNIGEPIMTFRVTTGRRIMVGPITAPSGMTNLMLTVREENLPEPVAQPPTSRQPAPSPSAQRLVNLALADLQVIYVASQ